MGGQETTFCQVQVAQLTAEPKNYGSEFNQPRVRRVNWKLVASPEL